LSAATQGHLDDIAEQDIKDFENGSHDFVKANHADIHKDIKEKQALDDDINGRLDAAIKAYKEEFLSTRKG
ncbi:MAG: F0F1 ATP synthase subunit alpha, partial [Candidatus Eremiobacteraeota bacterium]|nr:F0F1 ATP synthase subunit alpha [Candidatus Eremiobacteraeota bacterium]